MHQAALVYCDYYQGGGSQLNTVPRMLYLKTALILNHMLLATHTIDTTQNN